VRRGLIDGTPVTSLVGDIWPLLVMAVVFIPLGVRVFGLAERYAKHQLAQAVGDEPHGSSPHGWDGTRRVRRGLRAASPAGLVPTRVVTATAGDYGVIAPDGERRAAPERPAATRGRRPDRAARGKATGSPSGLPWTAPTSTARIMRSCHAAAPSSATHRRSGGGAGPCGNVDAAFPRCRADPRPQPRGAWSATSVPHPNGASPVIGTQQGRPVRRHRVAVRHIEGCRAGCPVVAVCRPRDGFDRLTPTSWRVGRWPCWDRPGWEVDARQRAARGDRSMRDPRGRRAQPATTTSRLSVFRAAASSSTRRARAPSLSGRQGDRACAPRLSRPPGVPFHDREPAAPRSAIEAQARLRHAWRAGGSWAGLHALELRRRPPHGRPAPRPPHQTRRRDALARKGGIAQA
jgi:hypothetical protein